MSTADRAARLLRIRAAERQAAAAEREMIDAMRQHRIGLVARLDHLHACYTPQTGVVQANMLRGDAFQRDRIDQTRRETMTAIAALSAAHGSAAEKCREADRQERSAEKYAERAARTASELRAKRADAEPPRRTKRR